MIVIVVPPIDLPRLQLCSSMRQLLDVSRAISPQRRETFWIGRAVADLGTELRFLSPADLTEHAAPFCLFKVAGVQPMIRTRATARGRMLRSGRTGALS